MLSRVQVLVFGLSAIIAIFLSIISLEIGYSQNITDNVIAGNGNENVLNINGTKGDVRPELYWNDSQGHCKAIFTCTFNLTDGWNDKNSFQLSTENNINKTWSSLNGKEVGVKPNDEYKLITHLKLNKWATQSHVALEGFNETSGKWYQIEQCPSGINGPLDWEEYECVITIRGNISKVKPILNAGWSSQEGATAVTLFDSIQFKNISSTQSKFAVLKFDKYGKFLKGWGSEGSSDGQFLHAHGISVDSSDNVYVTDGANCNVQKFTNEGKFITSWLLEARDIKKCEGVESLDVDRAGHVYVARHGQNRTDKFTNDGKFIKSWGSKEPGNYQMILPVGITIDSSGNLLISEQGGVIKKFTPEGKFITKWGSRGSGEGQFLHLHDIELDSYGNMYVADKDNFKIHKFTKDGKFIKSWGSKGSGEGQFTEPHGIAIDASDNVYVVDEFEHRIQQFDSEGNFIKIWASDNSENGPTADPHGIDIDSSGNFYVSDSLNFHQKERLRLIKDRPLQ